MLNELSMRRLVELLLTSAFAKWLFGIVGILITSALALRFHRDAVQRDELSFAEMAGQAGEDLRRSVAIYHDALNGIRSTLPNGAVEAARWRADIEQFNWRSRARAFLAVGLAARTDDSHAQLMAWQARNGIVRLEPGALPPSAALSDALHATQAAGGTGSMPATELDSRLDPNWFAALIAPQNGGSGALGIVLVDPNAFETSYGPALAQGRVVVPVMPAGAGGSARFARDIHFVSLGRNWSYRIVPGANFPWQSRPSPAWSIGLLGMVMTALICAALELQQRRRRELLRFADTLEQRVQQRTMELEQANAQLSSVAAREQELNSMKTRFIATMSHELHTPLSVISCAAQLLQRYGSKVPPAVASEQLWAISGAVRRLSDLGEEILLVSRDEGSRMHLRDEPLLLESIFEEIARECALAAGRSVPLRLELSAELDGAHGDGRLLRRIGTNLISNACKYSPLDSPITVSARREGDHLILSVSDAGVGIAYSDQARLFIPFQRGENVDHLPGLGLGLVIVHRAVVELGGTVEIDSKLDRGTVATVRLPLFQR